MIRSLHIVPDRDRFRVLVTHGQENLGSAMIDHLARLVGRFAAEVGLHFGEELTIDVEGAEASWLGEAWLRALVEKLPPAALDKLWIQVDTLRRQRSGPHAQHHPASHVSPK